MSGKDASDIKVVGVNGNVIVVGDDVLQWVVGFGWVM